MEKFKVLKLNELYMVWLGLLTYNLNEPKSIFLESYLSYHTLGVMTIGMISCFGYFVEYLSVDVLSALGGLKICFAALQIFGVYFSLGLKMDKVKELHQKLQNIVDGAETIEEYDIYWQIEQKCRTFSSRIGYYICFHVFGYVVSLFYSFYCIAGGDYDTSSWLLFFFMVPAQISNVWGWLLMWFIQFNMAFFYVCNMVLFTACFASSCFYINALCDCFKLYINSLANDLKQFKNTKDPLKQRKAHGKLVQNLGNIITFHVKIFETFYLLAEINSGSIFALLPANAVFMAISMYDVEQGLANFEAVAFSFNVSCIFCSMLWPASMCYNATLATNRITDLNMIAYDSNWYDYPIELQRNLILIYVRSQQPVYFTGMSLIRCTLEVFGKLFKTSCSYYVMFRTLEIRSRS